MEITFFLPHHYRVECTLFAEVQVLQYPPLYMQSTRQVHDCHQ